MSDKQYITSLIAEGEHEHQDFKYQISDARKIARSISAFANHAGGHLLIGVKDNGAIAGVSSDEEMYMIEQAANMYCQPPQQALFSLFCVDGKSILKADIAPATEKPVKAQDDHGHWKAYYRVADENVLASAMHVRLMQRDCTEEAPVVISYSEREQALLDYLENHGGITLSGYARLAHCSRRSAEQSVLNLCEMSVVALEYHNGQCLITKNN